MSVFDRNAKKIQRERAAQVRKYCSSISFEIIIEYHLPGIQDAPNIFFRLFKALSVKTFDYLKEEMGYRLSDRVLDIKRKLGVCVDLSSGRGYVTRHLTNHSVDQLYAVELSPTMLSQCEMPPESEVSHCLEYKKIILVHSTKSSLNSCSKT